MADYKERIEAEYKAIEKGPKILKKQTLTKERYKKEYSPLVEELSGIIQLDNDFNFKEGYSNYLMDKYNKN